MRYLAVYLIVIVGLFWGGINQGYGSIDEFDPKYERLSPIVVKMLSQAHFSREDVDDSKSQEWLKNYMERLDYNKIFFFQSDYDEFEKTFAGKLTQDIKMGNLDAAGVIFFRFRDRVEDRLKWVNERLGKDFSFDVDDTYLADRSEGMWPKDGKEADAIWEKRLTNDMLQETLAREIREEEKKAIKGSQSKSDEKEGGKEDEISPQEELTKRYERFARTIREYDDEDVVVAYLSSLTQIYDPHTLYLGPSILEDFEIGMKLSLFGIGAVLTTEEGYCTVKEVIVGGPADLDKRLKINDRIVGVAQADEEYVDVVDMKLRSAVRLIRGEKGTTVRLKIIPAEAASLSEEEEIIIVRDKINLREQRAKAELIEQNVSGGGSIKVGVIDLPSFYGDVDNEGEEGRSSTEDVAALIKRLKKENIDGLILDLRYNGGGLLSEAVDLVGLFIDEGPVVQVRNSQGAVTVLSDEEGGSLYDGPLVVLTNRASASASEICAGALQNYGRALIVGDKSTHGKGTVQAVLELGRHLRPFGGVAPEAGAVKLTIQKFYLPNGHSTQNRGVLSDIHLPSPNDYLEIGESHLPHSLPWDEIKPAVYESVGNVSSEIIENLKKRSEQRIQESSQYELLFEEINRLKKRLEDKYVSLNKKERFQEIQERKKRNEKLKELVRSSSEKQGSKVIAITLDDLEGQEVSEESDGEDVDFMSHTSDLHLMEAIEILSDWLGEDVGIRSKKWTAKSP